MMRLRHIAQLSTTISEDEMRFQCRTFCGMHTHRKTHTHIAYPRPTKQRRSTVERRKKQTHRDKVCYIALCGQVLRPSLAWTTAVWKTSYQCAEHTVNKDGSISLLFSLRIASCSSVRRCGEREGPPPSLEPAPPLSDSSINAVEWYCAQVGAYLEAIYAGCHRKDEYSFTAYWHTCTPHAYSHMDTVSLGGHA